MTDLSELRERLENAEKPSRDLDVQIYRAIVLQNNYAVDFKAFTKSLDAAIALVERALPGWEWDIGTYADCHRKGYFASLVEDGFEEDGEQVFGATPALALCVALLKELESSNERVVEED
jgi:hypothetical protein